MTTPPRRHWFSLRTPKTSRIGISNSRKVPLVVAVEPWANDYTLLPGEELQVVAIGTDKSPWFEVVEWDEACQVYCNDADSFRVTQNGVELQCGHNRQPTG